MLALRAATERGGSLALHMDFVRIFVFPIRRKIMTRYIWESEKQKS
uniref:Uncharacterized protein n=1 Tax=Candidatus Kentrum sp. TUN TaxID=2126343 RepID=A0A450ZRV4_9GAMM|nr:MAG: hypothetical protein BECKTUN1418F_GA0071002_108812 [Candidatus Kentron sp. TUN]VFK62786.1 MAG: hypothetical protein BECKTUN1418E_GA0071001_108613 [Candidatus Kentron sp. TUN]